MKAYIFDAIVVALLFMAGGALAQDARVHLNLSTWVPMANPLNPALQAWADDIEKESNGTISSTLHTSEQLGKAFDHYDMARNGIADFAYVAPGFTPGRFAIIQAGELPFLYTNGKEGSAAFDAWYRQYATKEMGDVHFCFAFVVDPGAFHSRKKIVLPEDVKGLKIRPSNGTSAKLITLLGGANVRSAAPEARDALERGVIDATTFPWGSTVMFGIDRVAKFHMNVPLFGSTFAWVMNKDKYASMSAAQKKVIDAHCTTEWAQKVATPWADFEHGGIATVAAESGQDVYELTPPQLAQWRRAAAPLDKEWAQLVRKAGYDDPEQILASLRKSLTKYRSAF